MNKSAEALRDWQRAINDGCEDVYRALKRLGESEEYATLFHDSLRQDLSLAIAARAVEVAEQVMHALDRMDYVADVAVYVDDLLARLRGELAKLEGR